MNQSDVQNTKINVINSSQLATLRGMQKPGHADLVTELIDLFLEETKSQLKGLHKAHVSNDAKEIRRVAHLLKGSSASIGARQMAALYQELEGKDQANRNTEGLLLRLDQEFELVRSALEVERKEIEG